MRPSATIAIRFSLFVKTDTTLSLKSLQESGQHLSDALKRPDYVRVLIRRNEAKVFRQAQMVLQFTGGARRYLNIADQFGIAPPATALGQIGTD